MILSFEVMKENSLNRQKGLANPLFNFIYLFSLSLTHFLPLPIS